MKMENKRNGDLSSGMYTDVWFENIHKQLDDMKYHNEYIGNDYYIDTYPLSNEQAKLITNTFIPTLENLPHDAISFTIDNGTTFNVKESLKKLYLIVASEEYTPSERELLMGLRRQYVMGRGVFKPKSESKEFDSLF